MNKVVHITEELHAELKRHADSEGMLMGEIVEMLLSRYVEQTSRRVVEKQAFPDREPTPKPSGNPYSRPPFWLKT